MKSRCHRFVSGIIKEKRKCGETEVVSNVKIKTNQSTKQITQVQNSGKFINHFDKLKVTVIDYSHCLL